MRRAFHTLSRAPAGPEKPKSSCGAPRQQSNASRVGSVPVPVPAGGRGTGEDLVVVTAVPGMLTTGRSVHSLPGRGLGKDSSLLPVSSAVLLLPAEPPGRPPPRHGSGAAGWTHHTWKLSPVRSCPRQALRKLLTTC